MSFTTRLRTAADISLPPDRRFLALCNCVAYFAPVGFRATMAQLAPTVGARGQSTSDQISEAVELLANEHVRWQEFEAHWNDHRRARKRAGQRAVGPDERAHRDSIPWLTWPRANIHPRRLYSSIPPDDAFPFRPGDQSDFEIVRAVMPACSYQSPAGFSVRVYDDWLLIPSRIANPPPSEDAVSRLSDRQTLMLHCLYTRHVDGYVRQRNLRPLLAADEPWVVPYVVALVGEYVVEIVQEIVDGLSLIATPGSWQRRRYGRFVSDNADFIDLTRQRVWSYWGAYYSVQYARPGIDASNRPEYPGFAAVRMLREAATDGW